MIENACPYAPGELKPESMPGPANNRGVLRRLRNGKTIALLFSIFALTLLYGYSYPSLNWGGSPVLFQDWYVVKMSIYTYLISMITYYFREYRTKNRD
jgi:hypothetical protein